MNEVRVIGVPDDTWGGSIAAVIRLVDGLARPTPEDLHAYCRDRHAAHKAPSLWFFVASYPTTASGKIQKFVLQDGVRDHKIAPAKLIESRRQTASATRGDVVRLNASMPSGRTTADYVSFGDSFRCSRHEKSNQ